jgi:hypothetical protein
MDPPKEPPKTQTPLKKPSIPVPLSKIPSGIQPPASVKRQSISGIQTPNETLKSKLSLMQPPQPLSSKLSSEVFITE